MAAREQEMALVEKAVGDLFTEISAEIAGVKQKVEESAAVPESPAAQPVPEEPERVVEVKAKAPLSAAPQDTVWQKKCPMCGGQMNFHGKEQMWMCYVCAYEEQGKGEQKSQTHEPAAPQDTEGLKKCPMCGGQMNFQLDGEKWMCYTCAYEESKEGEVPVEGEVTREQISVPGLTTVSEMVDEKPKMIKGPSPSDSQPAKKKTCPNCRKKMNWHASDKAWRCPFCEYERRI
jgi:ribosomal protein L37AE/L43A